jgi:hypothetical protein
VEDSTFVNAAHIFLDASFTIRTGAAARDRGSLSRGTRGDEVARLGEKP